MYSKDNLTKRFSTANLPLDLPGAPFANRDENIFQMDILTRDRSEAFRLYPGHEDNQVRVQGTDKGIRQLVLYVREPVRTFEVEHVISKRRTRDSIIEGLKRSGAKITKIHKTKVIEARTTPDSKRHYLCGHDESHLFIAQLPKGVVTVREAHEALRAPEARGKDAIRQGEWFFIELTKGEKDIVQHAIGQGRVQKNAPLRMAFAPLRFFGSRANNVKRAIAAHEHVVGEVIIIRTGGAITVYARGTVRHVDHKTLNIRDWTRVARNNEPTQLTGGQGISWID